MITSGLINDEKTLALLKSQTKHLVEETFTMLIEIMMGKSADLWTEEEINDLKIHAGFDKKKLSEKPLLHKRTDGTLIVEYTDAVRILSDYFAASPYGSAFKNRIAEEQKDNDEFVDKTFIKEFDKQCEKERNILYQLRLTRNSNWGHAIEDGDIGDVLIWIKQLMVYLDSFAGYRMQVLSQYDKNIYGKLSDQRRIEEYYTKASELKEQCFASDEDYKVFRFGKNTYKVSSSYKEEFELLISDMAKSWDRGVEYLLADRTYDLFFTLLEEYYTNYDYVMDFDKKRTRLLKASEDERAILYMSMLYGLKPDLGSIYWKGKMYSDSYFASLVLQILTRHPKRYSFEDKKETLLYRIRNFSQWKETDGKFKGLGINLVMFCQEHLLSNYFRGLEDVEAEELAKKFEDTILACNDHEEYVDENYDEIISIILELTAKMKGAVTYMLPVPEDEEGTQFKAFRRPNQFRSFFIDFVSTASSVNEVYEFVTKIRDDINLKWFLANYDSFAGKES
jgi:hypothetical protein